MQRRKFVIGMGALASGTAAALGTGAFSAAEMQREAQLNVVNDASGLIGLIPGDTDLVEERNGQLHVSFTSDNGGEGVNVNSKYQVGAMFDVDDALEVDSSSPTTHPAFEVRNQTESDQNLVLSYSLDNPESVAKNGSRIFLQARGRPDSSSGGTSAIKTKTVEFNHETGSDVIAYTDAGTFGNYNDDRIPAGKGFGVSILVDTTGPNASVEEDLSGTLNITAGDQALAQE